MATVKHIGTIAKILRKSRRDIGALVKEAGIDKEVSHASQLTDEEADTLIKIHGVFLMEAKKGKQ
jgi:hypothetical protein